MSAPSSERTPTIVVGFDGSPASLDALQWAAGEARLRGSRLLAVHAWRYLPDASSAGFGAAGTPRETLIEDFEHQQGRAERSLAEAVASLEPGTVVEQRTVEGHPAEVLVDASLEADLLVVGSRGHGTVASALLGSVSLACVHHAECPVVVLRDRSHGRHRAPFDPEEVIARERAQNERTWEALTRVGVQEGAALELEFVYETGGSAADRALAEYLRETCGYHVDLEPQGVCGYTPPIPVGRAMLDEWVSAMVFAGHDHGGCAFDGWTATVGRGGARSSQEAEAHR